MSDFIKDDFFKIDCEPHLIGDMEQVNHFPGVQMWWKASTTSGTSLSNYMSHYGTSSF